MPVDSAVLAATTVTCDGTRRRHPGRVTAPAFSRSRWPQPSGLPSRTSRPGPQGTPRPRTGSGASAAFSKEFRSRKKR